MAKEDDAPVLVWFRRDLRLADNPALSAAADSRRPVVALYVLDEASPGVSPLGGAQRWWLHHSLESLRTSLSTHGVPLVLRSGPAAEIVSQVVEETGAAEVVWNRLYEPPLVTRDSALKATLSSTGIAVRSFGASLLYEPWTVKTGSGEPFKVFSAFWKACLRTPTSVPLPAPGRLSPFGKSVRTEPLDSWSLVPTLGWADGFSDAWRPGEGGARELLDAFVHAGLDGYGALRNRPDLPHTSRLSPHLHWGEISPRQAAGEALLAAERDPRLEGDAAKFLSELGWREFSAYLLYHWPKLPEANWRRAFDDFPWRDDSLHFRAWSKGLTGYPIVDAGMRELWTTGWMHNRVRMIVASFLIKDLMIDWRRGAAWFWDTLVDADLANNAASWQWVAGSGADAAPYFRVFNPVTQGRTHDPAGDYVRRWIPELADLPNAFVHAPFEAPADVLAKAGVQLGKTYPKPIVDHAQARGRALSAFKSLSR